LSLELPAEARGRELSADELEQLSARLMAFDIRPLEQNGQIGYISHNFHYPQN